MMTKQIEIIEAKHQYTEDEKRALGHTLAELEVKLQDVKDEKRVALQRFKDRIEGFEGDIIRLARNLFNGNETRPFRCEVEFDYAAGVKIYRDVDTKALVDERPMNPDDRQRRFV